MGYILRMDKSTNNHERMHPDDIVALAQAVAANMSGASHRKGSVTRIYCTADELAARYGVSRDWVYTHADELGATRLGTGPRARMRFAVATADLWMMEHAGGPVQPRRRRRNRHAGQKTRNGSPMIPVHPTLLPPT